VQEKAAIREQLVRKIDQLHRKLEKLAPSGTDPLLLEGLYRTLEHTSRAGIYVVQDGKFQFVNQYAAEYWGYPREDLIGTESMSLVHPEDRERVRQAAIQMLLGNRTSSYEFRTISKSGDIRWITEVITSIRYKGQRAALGNSMDITEQIEARDKLAELEALEASILEAIPHAVIGLKNRRIIFANDGVERVFGWRADELIGTTTRVLYRSDNDWDAIARELYSTLETRRTHSTEFPCRRKDGRPIECLTTASRIGDSLKDKNIVITYEDITDRKIAEEAYRTMADSSQAGVYVVQDGVFQFVNENAAKYAGYSQKELTGMNSMQLVLPEDRFMVKENTHKLLHGEKKSPHEFRIATKDGRIRWIMETVTFIAYRGRRAVLGNSMDITEMIEARAKMEKLEALEASILEAIPHAVIGLQDRRVIFANDGLEAVFGWKAQDIVGMSSRILYRTDRDYEAVAKILYSTLEKKRTVSLEFTCRRKDGRDIECLLSASRTGESLQNRRIVITYEDITERNRAKEELERSRQQMRNLSAHLQSIREKERTRIARELHDELGQLLTALNMDIILLNRKIPPEQRELRERINAMSGLVDVTMKTLKRIYMDLRPGMLDHLGLPVAIEWQANEFSKRTGIPCRITVKPEDMQLNADLSTAVFRIFQETLTNVSRHAQAKRVEVSLKLSCSEVRLVVKDNGKGITEEQMAKPDSFGLLGIRERVSYWGGVVKIVGKKGKGTTVSIRIPYRDRSDSA